MKIVVPLSSNLSYRWIYGRRTAREVLN